MYNRHRRRLARLVPLWLLVVAVAPLGAQDAPGRAEVEAAVRSAIAGDTAEALTHLEKALQRNPELAEAHYRKGIILSRLGAVADGGLALRRDAYHSLQEAVKWDAGNPMYLLELAKILLQQDIRVDAQRVLQRALEAAERADPATLAEVHYQLALFREVQWIRFRHRNVLPPEIDQLSGAHAFADPRYVWRLLDRSRTDEAFGLEEREAMMEHLAAALRSDPAHSGAASHLLAAYYDEGRFGQMLTEGERFVRAAPDDPRAYLGLGLALYASRRSDEAAGSFQYALELLPEDQREEFLAVSRLMTEDDGDRYDELELGSRAEARRRFWLVSDPLFLTPSNEFWIEYQARMAYADLRFGLINDGVPGWRTDRGTIWVRYGPPNRWATFPPSMSATDFEAAGQITTVWSYGEHGPVFLFRQNPGFRKAIFANDFRFYADDMRSVQPSIFASPTLPSLAQLPVQAARFRGAAGGMVLEVHAALPLDSLRRGAAVSRATVETGLFVLNKDGKEIVRLAESGVVDFPRDGGYETRSWRADVPSGEPFVVAVEAREPLSWAAATFRENMAAKAFPDGQPSMSDLLLASKVEPKVEQPLTRNDFEVVPAPRLLFEADEPVAIYLELYNLLPDDEQFASYEMEIVVTVEEVYREGFFRRLVGGLGDRVGVTEEGERSVQLRFGREQRVLARDVIPEYFQITMDKPPAGVFRVDLKVHDRNADVELVSSRVFEIVGPGTRR